MEQQAYMARNNPYDRPGCTSLETVRISDALNGRFDITAEVYLEHDGDFSFYRGIKNIISATNNFDKKFTGHSVHRLVPYLDEYLSIDDEFMHEVI